MVVRAPAVAGRSCGGAAGERCEAEECGLALGFDLRDIGSPLVTQGCDADLVEAGGTTGVDALAGQRVRLVEQVDDPPRDRETFSGRGCIDIGAGCRRDDRDADGVRIGLGRADVTAGGFDVAADSAGEIDFVADVESYVVGGTLAVEAGEVLELGGAGVIAASARVHLWLAVGLRAAQRGAGAIEAGDGDAEVGVRCERVRDEAIEDGVAVHTPPVVVGRGRDGGGVGGDERRRRLGWDDRRDIVGAGGARGERQRREAREEGGLHDAGPIRLAEGSRRGRDGGVRTAAPAPVRRHRRWE